MRLIDADAFRDEMQEYVFPITANNVMGAADAYYRTIHLIDNAPTIEAVPLADIYRIIAGHSDYHGDNILAALTCIAEGKAVNPVKPLEAEPVRHGKPNPHIVRWCGSNGEVVSEYQDGWECPFCAEPDVKNYCPNCGAKMDGDSHATM